MSCENTNYRREVFHHTQQSKIPEGLQMTLLTDAIIFITVGYIIRILIER